MSALLLSVGLSACGFGSYSRPYRKPIQPSDLKARKMAVARPMFSGVDSMDASGWARLLKQRLPVVARTLGQRGHKLSSVPDETRFGKLATGETSPYHEYSYQPQTIAGVIRELGVDYLLVPIIEATRGPYHYSFTAGNTTYSCSPRGRWLRLRVLVFAASGELLGDSAEFGGRLLANPHHSHDGSSSLALDQIQVDGNVCRTVPRASVHRRKLIDDGIPTQLKAMGF